MHVTLKAGVIHSDQTGFIKGRYIGEKIRLIEDVMEYTKVHNIPGILISLDFKKAFDSLEWRYIMNTLLILGPTLNVGLANFVQISKVQL